jgi:hypothetical protein
MSTKVSIKWRAGTSTQPGFLLYEDCLDSFGRDEGDSEPPVYLRLDGVAVQLRTLPTTGVSVTVSIPRELARELGMLPPARSAG